MRTNECNLQDKQTENQISDVHLIRCRKAFEKYHPHFLINIQEKLVKWDKLQNKSAIYSNPMKQIRLNHEKFKTFPVK